MTNLNTLSSYDDRRIAYNPLSMQNPNTNKMSDAEWNDYILRIDAITNFQQAHMQERRLTACSIAEYIYRVARNAALNGKCYCHFTTHQGGRIREMSQHNKNPNWQVQLRGLERPTEEQAKDIVLQAFLDVEKETKQAKQAA